MDINFIKSFEVSSFETSSKNKQFLLEYSDRYYQINETLANLINALKDCEDLNEANDKLKKNNKNNSKISDENLLKSIIEKKPIPIINDDSKKEKQSSFRFKTNLISSSKLSPITNRLKFFFNPIIFIFFISSSLLSILYFIFFAQKAEFHADLFSYFNIGLIFFLSVIFHELGHASASKYYKINHGNIGFAIYLYFPVFFADVSRSWLLDRKKRIVIDLGGIYFQIIFLLPLILYYFVNNSSIAYFAIYSILISFIYDLNPFFKFDGYWITSDILGVPNLREKTKEIFTYYYRRCIKNEKTKEPFLLELKNREKFFFFFYFVLSNLFFGYIFLYRIPLYLLDFLRTYPYELVEFINNFNGNSFPGYQEINLILSKFFIGVLLIYFCYNTLKRIINIKL